MSQLSIRNLTFAYDGSYDNIFENVNLQIDTDWKLGLIGRNGRGKTTFLKLLQGKYEYAGTIHATVKFDYFPFEVHDKNKNTIEIVNEIADEYEMWTLEKELSMLSVDESVLNRPFGTLSNGEQTKVLLAALFLREHNFLLIDEPTDHLDLEAREAVSKYLKSKKSFILVSHDRHFLDSCIDHVLAINKTNIDVQSGNFSSWWKNKELNDQYEISENDILKIDIERLTEASRQTASWSEKIEKSKIGTHVADRGFVGHQAAKMMKRSKNTQSRQEKAITQKSELLKNIESNESLTIKPLKFHSDTLIEVNNLSVAYGERTVCENVSFKLFAGQRLALTGKNGCGKSSIIKILLGEDIEHAGEVKIPKSLVISYISQDTSFLSQSLKEFAYENKIDESLFKAILRKMDFSRVQFEKDMSEFSAGQKKKTLLAKSLCQQANVYIWDEPLNYIDVFSRMQIVDLIKSGNPSMIFVEHDKDFTDSIATQKIEIIRK